MKKFLRYLLAAAIVASLAVFVSWYYVKLNATGVEHTMPRDTILRVGGSTTVYPFALAAANAYMEKNPEETIIVTQSSTGEGLAALIADQFDLVGATRSPVATEIAKIREQGDDAVVTTIGRDSVVIIVHPSKGAVLKAITRSQAKAIFFDGTIRDWSELDPQLSGTINVYVRDPALSGTAALFAQKVAGTESIPFVSSSQDVHLSPLLVPTVASDPDGIAFTALKWTTNDVMTIPYGETIATALLPSPEVIRSGAYPLIRDMLIVSRRKKSRLAEKYLAFLLGEEGRRILEETGFAHPR